MKYVPYILKKLNFDADFREFPFLYQVIPFYHELMPYVKTSLGYILHFFFAIFNMSFISRIGYFGKFPIGRWAKPFLGIHSLVFAQQKLLRPSSHFLSEIHTCILMYFYSKILRSLRLLLRFVASSSLDSSFSSQPCGASVFALLCVLAVQCCHSDAILSQTLFLAQEEGGGISWRGAKLLAGGGGGGGGLNTRFQIALPLSALWRELFRGGGRGRGRGRREQCCQPGHFYAFFGKIGIFLLGTFPFVNKNAIKH